MLWSEVGDTVFQAGSWAVICLHGIDDGTLEQDALGWQAMSMSSFKALLDYIQARDLWIAPFGNIARYIRERRSVEVRVLERTEKRLVLLLTDGLDNGIFDQPLSFRFRLPAGWEAVRVLEGGRLIPFILRPDGYLSFDATPDRGLITIVKKSSPTSLSCSPAWEHPRSSLLAEESS
jgi:hypothetical protein